jgi:hypothetical protein
MTNDGERAKAFYGATLGWTFEGMPMNGPDMPAGTYWLVKSGDRVVCGMFPMEGPEFAGQPDHWFAHIAVDNVDARVGRVKAAGGEVLRAPFSVPGVGRIAIVKDATGAVVGWMTPAPEMSGPAG